MSVSNVIQMAFKSISLAASNSTYKPGALQPWVDEIEAKVATDGKFTKRSVAYSPISPPPVFWDYKCKKCRWWMGPASCKVVAGTISPRGWCAIWVPPSTYRAFTWPVELIKGEW